ncbi:MAG: threonine aldolase, partial [Saprospiraceae bacterium]
QNIRPVQTNILIFDLAPPRTPAEFLEALKQKGVVASAFGPQTVRFVTHLDVTQTMVQQVIKLLRN